MQKVKEAVDCAASVINPESMVPCLLSEMLLDANCSASLLGSKNNRKREGD